LRRKAFVLTPNVIVADGSPEMVESVKVLQAVTGIAAKTAPNETVAKAGSMGRTDIPKKEIMDRDLFSRSPDASLKSDNRVLLPHPVHVAPTSYFLDFEASVVESMTDSECRIIALKGRIGHGQRAALEKFFDANLPQDGRRVILDMDGVVSMSSSGWGLVVAQLQRLKKSGGSVSLCGMHGEVEQCFRILDLHALFSVFPSVSEAMKSPVQKNGDFSASEKIKASLTAPDSLENLASLPLEEKIKRIVAENPYLGAGRIAKLLRSQVYGTTIINRWTLLVKLKNMNLGSKKERYRFFRSS
jgi:anti-anti-sigma factor